MKLFFLLIISSQIVHADSQMAGSLIGSWVSKGQMETRTLIIEGNGKGQFISDHTRGSCFANLDAIVDGEFVMAGGEAPNCQQRNNAVSFEFYCQQTAINSLRCNIRSTHKKSGNEKQGVEVFDRL